MPNDVKGLVPARRTADLVVRVQGDETLVLDTRTDTAHCLPAEVGRVWQACTEGRTLADIASASGVDAAVAESSVAQLSDLGLLAQPATGIERRKFIRRSAMVVGGSLAIPVLQSVVAPQAAFAGTYDDCVVTVRQTGCDYTSGQKVKYDLTLTGFVPNQTYTIVITYKNYTETYNVTVDASGSGTFHKVTTNSLPIAPGQGPHSTVAKVYDSTGRLVCTSILQTFVGC